MASSHFFWFGLVWFEFHHFHCRHFVDGHIVTSPANTRLFLALHPMNLLLTRLCWMWGRWHYLTWRNDKTLYRLSGDKRATAVDVCALVIALLSGIRKVTASTSVCGKFAFWTVKHDKHLMTFPMRSFY